MKELLAGLRNYNTTIVAAIIAVLEVLKNYDLANIPPWLIPAALALFGVLARDAGKSSEDSGVK